MNTQTPPKGPAKGINDDDLYLIDLKAEKVIRRMGKRSDFPFGSNPQFSLGLNQAAMYGQQAKWFVK
jgi:hypothetical protein